MIRAVYISATDADAGRAEDLGLGLVINPSATAPHVLIESSTKATILAEPTTREAVDAALQPLLANEQAAAAQTAALATNANTIRDRAQAALSVNATFLALQTPTQAQKDAQLRNVTRECSAVIRLLLGELSDTTGT